MGIGTVWRHVPHDFLFCLSGLLLFAGVLAENLPGSRGWFHDLRWTVELKGRSAWAKITSTDFDPETYPGEDSPQAMELQRKIDEWYPQALARYERWRRFDSMISTATFDGLNRLFSSDRSLVRSGREFGLGLVDRMPMLKHFFVHILLPPGPLAR